MSKKIEKDEKIFFFIILETRECVFYFKKKVKVNISLIISLYQRMMVDIIIIGTTKKNEESFLEKRLN